MERNLKKSKYDKAVVRLLFYYQSAAVAVILLIEWYESKTVALLFNSRLLFSHLPCLRYWTIHWPAVSCQTFKLHKVFVFLRKFSLETMLKPVCIYGGISVSHHLWQVQRGCNFLVATPRRLKYSIEEGLVREHVTLTWSFIKKKKCNKLYWNAGKIYPSFAWI